MIGWVQKYNIMMRKQNIYYLFIRGKDTIFNWIVNPFDR